MDLLTPEEVAAILKIAPSTLKKWRVQHRGPGHISVGGSIRYPRADLDTWLTSLRAEQS